MLERKSNIIVASLLLSLAGGVEAGTFTTDFNSGELPANTMTNGTTVIDTTGGVNNSGVLKLTKALNGQSGSFVISDLDAGNPVYGFDLTTKVRLGGGTSSPADGFSINYDPNAVPESTASEEGTTGGITFAFDLYDNGSETPPAPSIDLKVGGVLIATHKMSIADFDTGTNFVDLHAQVAADGAASLAFKGQIIFTNIYFTTYQPLSAASFVIGGRTGGANENQFFDNLSITTYTQPKIGFGQGLKPISVLAGQDAVFNVTVNNADSAAYQWYKNGTAIAGATSASYTVPAVTTANSGEKYKVVVTGPNNTITSDEVTLTAVALTLPTVPQLSYNFDDGLTPDGTLLSGVDQTIGGYIAATGGVNDSGVLHLTDAVNGANGSLVIDDPNAGAPVTGFTASFDVLVGGGTVPPADGFSFNFGNNIPDAPNAGEDGVGTGLTVGFDIYDNGGENPPAPSIDVRYKGAVIGSVHMPYTDIETVDTYAPVVIQLANDGTITVAYKGNVLFNHLLIPGFGSIAGGRFAIVGRTGGLNENIWVDNLQITTDLTPGPLRITTAPSAQTVLVGKTATFNVAVNDTNGVTYQFFKNGTAIAGATSASYTTPVITAADNGTTYKVAVTKNGVTVTSDEVALTTVDLAVPTSPTVSFNFDDGNTPAGTVLAGVLNGTADQSSQGYISTTGGVNDSGVVHLTDAVNGAAGAFIIEPLLSGAEVSSFTAAFDVLIGGGSVPPADGFSFNFAPDVPDTTIGVDGAGTGLSIVFDIYDNGNEVPPAPSIDVRYKGAVVASQHLTYQEMETGTNFQTVIVRVSADGKLDMSFGDRVLFHGLQLPNYTFIANGKFGFNALTGGLNENFWLDNVKLALTKSTVLKFTTEPADLLLLPGQTANISATVSDPAGITFQVLSNGVAIAGATTNNYITAPVTAASSGTKYSIRATGPGGTLTSREAVITVVQPITISNPNVSFNFDDGQVPPGTEINAAAAGGGYISDGGVSNSLALHLTDNVNGEGGTLIIYDFNNGQAVSGFTAHFQMRVGGGTAPPADGFAFEWVSDLASGTQFGEDGSGTGLIVSWDIYDNGNETPPAPSIDVRYMGTLVATVHMTYQQMETGDNYGDVYVRVQPDGTFDLQYNGKVIFNNVQLPGFTPMTGGSFAIGARTGGLNENQWLDNMEIATSTGAAAPTISSIHTQSGNVVIEFTGGGSLEMTTALGSGTWTPVPNSSTSPVTVPATGQAAFFRVKQ
jgi:hypothetical protein